LARPDNKHIFVSYAQLNIEPVTLVVDALRREYRMRGLPVDVWMDTADLRPGERWDNAIERALLESIGLLIFVTPASMESQWVQFELGAAAAANDRLIIPVILKHVDNLPPMLAERQWIDLSGPIEPRAILDAARRIAETTERYIEKNRVVPPVPQAAVPTLAKNLADEARGTSPTKPDAHPDSVFVVHGHDEESRKLVCAFLEGLNIKPVVLSQTLGPAQSLLQKFFQSSKETKFSIVILSADDLGASLVQYDAPGVGDKALQFRARQNVILELGFFYGYLGWENVFVIYREPRRVFPNFERPSDLDGAVFDAIDAEGRWRETLKRKLAEAGFKIRAA
jgi:predicted nucleotide-binding protein